MYKAIVSAGANTENVDSIHINVRGLIERDSKIKGLLEAAKPKYLFQNNCVIS